MSTPQRAAIYARISLDADGDEKGVNRQLQDCRKLAKSLEWTVADEYVDNDLSGYSGKPRPEYARMLVDMADGTVDGVLIYHLDRLTRRPIEFEQFNIIATKAAIPLRCVSGDFDMATDDGLLMGRIYADVAAHQSAAMGRRQRRKNDEKAAAGIPHGGFRRPFGFKPDKITHVPAEVRIIRTMVDQYLAGKGVLSIARWLDNQDIRTVGGNQWTSTSVKGILTSGRIAGLRQLRKEIVGPGIWKPIITPEKRELVLAEFERRKVTGRRTPRRYLLSGLLRCSHCESKLYASLRTSATRQTTRRYVCSSSIDHGGCGRMTVVAAPLEDLIANSVLIRLDSPELAEALSGRQRQDDDVNALVAERDADQAQLLELAAHYAERQITMAEWIEARTRIEARVTKADRRLRNASSNPALADLTGQGGALRQGWSDLDLDVQATIVRAVVDHVVISPGTRGARVLDHGRVDVRWRV